jgi:hypothetical protein
MNPSNIAPIKLRDQKTKETQEKWDVILATCIQDALAIQPPSVDSASKSITFILNHLPVETMIKIWTPEMVEAAIAREPGHPIGPHQWKTGKAQSKWAGTRYGGWRLT